MDLEKLGPAETILQTLFTHSDHMIHNRPGMVSPDRNAVTGVRWTPVTYRQEDAHKVVYQLRTVRKRTQRIRVGVLGDDKAITDGPRRIGEYRAPGLFPEVAAWLYRQVADVYALDNEFAARWASYALAQDHRDMKVVLAAFMLVQARKGEAVKESGQVLFHDEDYREVGEAMVLLYRKDKKDLNPKLLLRIHDLLTLPEVAKLNHELGFGQSARNPFYGRWPRAVEKWLRYREENPRLLDGLVKAGFRTTVMELARRVRYKPEAPVFFEALRWKQAQAKSGHRTVAVGRQIKAAESWQGLSEAEICERIVADRPSYKRIVGLLPAEIGLSQAIAAAAVEAGCLSDKDLVILSPTLEELGLLEVASVKARWTSAVKAAEDLRAANIAKRVKSQATAQMLEEAADTAMKAAVEEVARNIRVYFMVDISGSMANSIEAAKVYVAKFLQAFPPDRLHVSVFNSRGREIAIRHPSAAGVQQAFRGIKAGGGTDYGAGVRALSKYRPRDDEDVLFIFVGDEMASPFTDEIRKSQLAPMAFGFVKIESQWAARDQAVRQTAAQLSIPCFLIDERTFEDPYAIPRTVRNLVASTPVGKLDVSAPRMSLVDQIMKTALLEKPAWA